MYIYYIPYISSNYKNLELLCYWGVKRNILYIMGVCSAKKPN
jgi:hypothetical protein